MQSIDITDLVTNLKKTWIASATQLVFTGAVSVPWLSWLGLPVISNLFKFIIEKIVTAIADALEMQAFFLNTALKKAGQAQDYINAVNFKNSLPPTATNEEYKYAEKLEMEAFRDFVMVSV